MDSMYGRPRRINKIVPRWYKRKNVIIGVIIGSIILIIILVSVLTGGSNDNTPTTQQATTQQATTQQATTQQATTQEGTTTINPVQSDDDSLDKNMITNEEITCASCGYVGIAPDTKEECENCGCNWTDKETPRCQQD